ncbi:MAG: LysM peptidoglycan-binding domain-containing protein [Candidatus Marinimicrobia bacterium]|nr:LysM peptidoglycan-binding domain-containing protein [Candidatus Neomarinimicrobiota bacterium]
MMIKKLIIVTGIIVMWSILSGGTAYAQNASTMSPEEYQTELARWKGRESSAGSELSRLEREIASLQKQLTNVEGNIEKERNEIFGLMSASDEEIRNYMKILNDLENDVAGLADLSEEELLGSVEFLEGIELRLEDLSENDFSAFEQNRQMLDDIENMLSSYRTVIPEPTQESDALASADSAEATEADEQEVQPDVEITDGKTPRNVTLVRKSDSYQVVRGDNLWDISSKEIIYNDPFQWLKIYSANRDQISDPDIIEIDQVFVIPREPAINEHWVSKGDNLSKIAAERYSNPFEWTRIYQANKSILESPDLLLPHTILIIPKLDEKKDDTPVNM